MISAVILTHNSETTIQKALESVSWCDEVLVIDDNSTDATQEIAKKAGAHVISRPLADDFAAQRNYGLAKAKNEWVLFLDSDEVITHELQAEIVEELKHPRFAGYYFTRKDYLWGRGLSYGETANVKLLRLGKKTAGKWERPVHEVWDIPEPTGIFKNPIHHFPHQDVAQFLSSINRYSTVNARYLVNKYGILPWWHVPAYPLAKFFKNYVLLQGFRDGTSGAVVAIMMSFHSFLTRAKAWLILYGKK